MRTVRTVVVSLVILLLLVLALSASVSLRVDEEATRLELGETGHVVSLVIVNPAARAVTPLVELDLLDPRNAVRGSAGGQHVLRPGRAVLSIPLALRAPSLSASDRKELPWYRLRYRVYPQWQGEKADPLEGILAVGQITPGVFELSAFGAPVARAGEPFLLRVRATHPVTRQPVAGVRVEGLLGDDDGDATGSAWKKARALTDAHGYASLAFKVPAPGDIDEVDALDDDRISWKVTGHRGEFKDTASGSTLLDRFAQILLLTDKPLYQPGQKLRVRALALDSHRRPVAGSKLLVKIDDPEDDSAFRAAVETSRFGVAHAEWDIPEGLRLGDYVISVHPEQQSLSEGGAVRHIKISRYQLPAFAVSVAPDRSYYLPGQEARVEVRASYLFGKPVPRGKVRVTHESERRWDYRAQKWEVEEEESYEGEAGADGAFTARINLAEQHSELSDRSYRNFRDVDFTAYFTDPSTGRSEQRRFSLRVSREPIHVYVLGEGYGAPRGFAPSFYVSTSYADGAPASCEVQVRAVLEKGDTDGKSRVLSHALTTVRTNRYGLARIRALNLASLQVNEPARLDFAARDSRGRRGGLDHSLWWRDGGVLQVETNKALYASGEPVEVQVRSNLPDTTVFVDVLSEGRSVTRRSAALRRGRAFLVLEPNSRFQKELQVVAYALGTRLPGRGVAGDTGGARNILFPAPNNLNIKLAADKAEYRPGDKALLQVSVRTPAGATGPSSLGVVVFDQAVEERARTDQQAGQGGPAPSFRAAVESFLGSNDQVGGVSRSDLEGVDLTQPPPEGFDLAAEVLLNRYSAFWPPRDYEDRPLQPRELFYSLFLEMLEPICGALASRYAEKNEYPKDEQDLRRFLSTAGLDLAGRRDPWGMPFLVAFRRWGTLDTMTLSSSGPDKRPGTVDDLVVERFEWRWFINWGLAINAAATNYHQRTGRFLRDEATLVAELKRAGWDWSAVRDSWGNAPGLLFGVDRVDYTITVRSAGPDSRFAPRHDSLADDLVLWTSRQDYTGDLRRRIDDALQRYGTRIGRFPEKDEELREALAASHLSLEQFRDPWNQLYHAAYSTSWRYGDRVTVRIYSENQQQQRGASQPVTQEIRWVRVTSAGPDGKQGTDDDFEVAAFSWLVAEETSASARAEATGVPLAGGIGGVVLDATGAVISGAKVSVIHKITEAKTSATSDAVGSFLLRNLPTGYYAVRIEMRGFKSYEMREVPVRSSRITRLEAILEVGSVSSTVTVEANAAVLETSVSVLSLAVPDRGGLSPRAPAPMATPRLREYFPETLLWLPELETGRDGRARFELPLADTITTWKLALVASNLEGQIGVAEKDLRAFQPFFVEHDPPRVLTEGDEIGLPVVLRNFLDKPLTLSLAMKPETWFALTGPAEQSARVGPGDFAREFFSFRAVASVAKGKQRVTASGFEAGDAVEKPVRVHPDGEERVEAASTLFTDSAVMELNVPRDAISGSLDLQLKLYPHLATHVLESIEGILQRPYGCAEQTISSTYPNLLLLRYAKQTGVATPLTRTALRNLRFGYERLLGYRSSDGGFSYWGRGEPDLALTAYAVRFLYDAQAFIPVAPEALSDAREFLVDSAGSDGRWVWRGWYGRDTGHQHDVLTAYVARILAGTGPEEEDDGDAQAAVARALDYLAPKTREWEEPYLLASVALAAQRSGQKALAAEAVERLRGMARDERGGAYWVLETNTPFYGWGLAGRIETSALVIQALAAAGDDPGAPLLSRGLLFLLRNKDRYGVWYSTQATVNVLDALLLLAREGAAVPAGTIQVLVNGRPASSIPLSAGDALGAPVFVDLSPFAAPGINRIEIRAVDARAMSAQAVAAYYVPWEKAAVTPRADADALRLAVTYDRLQAATGDSIHCRVKAERFGHRGYGMMVAEVGLPPGAEVDRASLDRAVQDSQWDVSHYDVLPDRVVLYLWPRAGGVQFSFAFRGRYAVRAKAAASILYDYYNPEATTTLAPPLFVVRREPPAVLTRGQAPPAPRGRP